VSYRKLYPLFGRSGILLDIAVGMEHLRSENALAAENCRHPDRHVILIS